MEGLTPKGRAKPDRTTSKNVQRCPSRNPPPEMKRSARATELDSNLTMLEEDIKRTKDQLALSESLKRQAQKESEESKNLHAIMSAKYEESQRELEEITALERGRNHELYAISKEMDRAWQAEVDARKDHHLVDLAALKSARNDIHRLKKQIQAVTESESAKASRDRNRRSEVEVLNQEMEGKLALIENLKIRKVEHEQSQTKAKELVDTTQHELEAELSTIESLQTEHTKIRDSLALVLEELELSRSRENTLKTSIKKIQEVARLNTELEISFLNRVSEQVTMTVQLHSAYESVDTLTHEYGLRESDLNAALTSTNFNIVNVKEKLERRRLEATKLQSHIKDTDLELRAMKEKNKSLKKYRVVMSELDLARDREGEMLARIAAASEETEARNSTIAQDIEQLVVVQTVKLEMETEISRQRTQLAQWRKAAEAAADALAEEEIHGIESSNNVMKKISGFWRKDHKIIT